MLYRTRDEAPGFCHFPLESQLLVGDVVVCDDCGSHWRYAGGGTWLRIPNPLPLTPKDLNV